MPPLLFSCCQSMSALAMAHTSLGDAGVLLVDLVGPSFAAHFIPALLEAFPVGLSLLAHDVFDYKRMARPTPIPISSVRRLAYIPHAVAKFSASLPSCIQSHIYPYHSRSTSVIKPESSFVS